MPYKEFDNLISHRSPGFVCERAGNRSKTDRFTARVSHEIRQPASPADLARLGSLIPVGAEQLLAFYARHDGFVLYRDTLSDAAGVELYRVAEMAIQTESLHEWLEMLSEDDDTNCLKTSIAIGESPQSGNYFAMTVEGPQTGKVFFVDHDDWHDEPFADSFDQFLTLVATSPAELLSETLGCIARYHDGHSDEQWIPIEYLPNVPNG